MKTFGSRIRELRREQGVGIKKAAPAMRLDYTYLSRLENDRVVPSAEVIDRISGYYGLESDELMLLANKVPADIRRILRENPHEALEYLRERFGGGEQQR